MKDTKTPSLGGSAATLLIIRVIIAGDSGVYYSGELGIGWEYMILA